jgi:phosphoglycerate dehydrogenase-like enzyme
MKCLTSPIAFLVWVLLSPLVAAQSTEGALRIVVTGFARAYMQEIATVAPRVDFIEAETEELVEKVAQADALIGSCDVEAIRAGKRLRWVQVYSAGVEKCMSSALIDSNIVLTNAKVIQGPQIADHAMALLLSLTRGLHHAMAHKQQRRWAREEYDLIELRGKTALIIGLGGIGTQVAERAAAFGMRVLATDPKDIPYLNSVERVGKPDQLRELLPRADVIFMCAPHTPETERMLGKEEFSLMKRGAYLVNVSRGKTIDTNALVAALRSEQLSGAGLDVTDPEPLPKDHVLWGLENVVVTPHVAFSSDRIARRRLDLVKENVRRFVQRLPLYHVVNKDRGY